MNVFGHPPACCRGMGWLPYDYVTRGLAEHFWSVPKKEWLGSGEFGGQIK